MALIFVELVDINDGDLDEVDEDLMELAGDKWEKSLLNDVETLSKIYAPDLEIGVFVSNTPAWEMEKARLSVTMTLCFNVAAMVVFTMLATTTADAAKSKPMVGLAGLFTATMATALRIADNG